MEALKPPVTAPECPESPELLALLIVAQAIKTATRLFTNLTGDLGSVQIRKSPISANPNFNRPEKRILFQ